MRRLLPALLLLPIHAHAQEAEAPKGMPQLDFANPLTISQIVWLVIVFAVLYALLSRWALPQVGRVVNHRAERIASDLDGARAAKAEADGAVAEATAANKRAHDEAQARIASAVAAAKTQAEAEAAVLNAELASRIASSEARIADARAAAMAGLREVATATAGAMVARLSGRTADPQALDAAMAAVMPQHAA